MIRSVDFPVDPRWIRNPTNSPLATKGERMAAAARTRLCIETIGLILSEHFSKPGRFFTTTRQQATSINAIEAMPGAEGWTVPNRWTVRLTRISMGTVDPITGGATMKAVQDAVARWCDVPNERDPIWHWVEPIGQEKRGFVKGADGSRRAWTGVRIELEDLAPGEPRRVVLATIAGFEVRAKAAIKERAKAAKMRGRTQVYHAAEGQQAASSAARGRAEEAFAKVTGKQGERPCATTSTATSARTPGNARYATDAATTAKPRAPSSATSTSARTAAAPASARAAEAGSEDATPRMLVDCPVCRAKRGIVCTTVGALVAGVHVERARLAGLASAGARVLGPKPATGPKKKARAAVILAGVPLSAHDPACCAHAQAAKGEPVTCCNCPAGCPEQAAMRAQARSVACAVCGAGYVDGPPCVNVPEAVRCPTCGTNWGAFAEGRCMVCLDCPGNVRLERYAPPFEYGVHASRARAAGLPPFPCVADLDAGAKPVPMKKPPCPECDAGSCPKCRGVAWTWLPGRGAEVWLALPWSPPDKRFTRETRLPDPPPETRDYREHDDAPAVTLHRTTITTRAGRLAWLFTTKDETRTT